MWEEGVKFALFLSFKPLSFGHLLHTVVIGNEYKKGASST